MDEIPKKKRGRKPKIVNYDSTSNLTIDTKDVISDINNKQQSIDNPSIIHLRTSSNVIQENNSYETSFCKYNPDISEPIAYTPDESQYSMIYNNLSSSSTNNSEIKDIRPDCLNMKMKNYLLQFNSVESWPETTTYACYWCCHTFKNTPFGVPLKYENEKFYCKGCFCSLECIVAYNFTNKEITDNVWETYNLVNLLSKKLNYKQIVQSAPDKRCLKMFGGYMNIDEFRQYTNKNENMCFNKYPMVAVIEQIEEINDYVHNRNDLNSMFSIKMNSIDITDK